MPAGIIKLNLSAPSIKRLLANTTLANDTLCPIAPQQLCNILLLPAEYQAVRVQYDDFGYLNNRVELVVEHPDIPVTEAGQELPRVALMYLTLNKKVMLQEVKVVERKVEKE